MSGVIDRDVLAAHIHRQLGTRVHSITPYKQGAEFVEHDETCEVSDDHLAHLLGRVHACTAPRTLVAHEGLPFVSCIARRITRRARELEKATGMSLPVPGTTRIESVLKLRSYRPSLLHMDIRPPNILAAAGSVRAIIDWSNALMGDPALEFARIAEWWRPCTRLRVSYENIRGRLETPASSTFSIASTRLWSWGFCIQPSGLIPMPRGPPCAAQRSWQPLYARRCCLPEQTARAKLRHV